MIEVNGNIDRIGENQKEILAADYKTGAPCPLDGTPPAISRKWRLPRGLAPLARQNWWMLLIWTNGLASFGFRRMSMWFPLRGWAFGRGSRPAPLVLHRQDAATVGRHANGSRVATNLSSYMRAFGSFSHSVLPIDKAPSAPGPALGLCR
jgi:hypothetical protein